MDATVSTVNIDWCSLQQSLSAQADHLVKGHVTIADANGNPIPGAVKNLGPRTCPPQ